MSYLADHARATWIIAEAMSHDAMLDDDPAVSGMLHALAAAYRLASENMMAEVRAGALDHSCSFDHRALLVPKCPACGAPRETK